MGIAMESSLPLAATYATANSHGSKVTVEKGIGTNACPVTGKKEVGRCPFGFGQKS